MLAPDAQALDQSLVALRTAATQVIEQPAATRDHLEQSPAGMVVLGVGFEVLRQIGNAPAQDRDLDLWRAGIRFVDPELGNHSTFCFTRQCHAEMDTPRLFLIDLVQLQG